MHEYRWFNQHQPQTLQSGVILLYIEAVFNVIFVGFASLFLLTGVGLFVGAFGIANEKKWGYGLGVASALLNLVLYIGLYGVSGAFTTFNGLTSMMFSGALIALLLHPMSRSYQRIWFR